MKQGDCPSPYRFWPLKKFCLYPSDLVKSSMLQLEKMLRKSNRRYLENQQTVLSLPDSPRQFKSSLKSKPDSIDFLWLFIHPWDNYDLGALPFIVDLTLFRFKRRSNEILYSKILTVKKWRYPLLVLQHVTWSDNCRFIFFPEFTPCFQDCGRQGWETSKIYEEEGSPLDQPRPWG